MASTDPYRDAVLESERRLPAGAGGDGSPMRRERAAKSPAPAPIARIPTSRRSSAEVLATGARAIVGPVVEGPVGATGVRYAAVLATSFARWIIACIRANSSVASSIVSWRLRSRPTR
jgi:hypothetical protein